MGIEIILGCLLFSGMVMGTTATVARVITDAFATTRASKAGAWDFLKDDRARRDANWARRRETLSSAWNAARQRRHKQAGGTGEYKPGAKAYLGDVYTGWWADRLANRQAKREHRGPVTWDPNRPPWHRRVDQAVYAGFDKAKAKWEARGNQTVGPQPSAVPTVADDEEWLTPHPDEAAWIGPVPDQEVAAANEVKAAEEQEFRNRSGDADTTPSDSTEGKPDPMTPNAVVDLPHDDPVLHPICPGCGEAFTMRRSDLLERGASLFCVPCRTNTNPTNKGDTMTTSPVSTAGSATGDAHDVESAIHQCGLLDDDLTAINTALDVIDENIDSAGTAAELIEAFLTSKSVDDSAVGGMSVARDMLSPTHIKALMDAVAVARQGVQSALDELRRLQDLEQQLNGADGSVLNGR